jgi:type IV pilus assembly protein PilC
MPMLRSLYTLEEQTEDEMIQKAVTAVRADVEAGSSLANAMDAHPTVFDGLYCSMVRSGEGSGRLEEALDRVAYQIEKLDTLRRQVKSAIMYPALVFGFAIVVMIVVVAFIVPVFINIFNEIAAETPGESSSLPIPTQITKGASDLLTHHWPFVIAGVIIAVIAFIRWKRSDAGGRQWDRLKLRIPFQIGDVVQKVALARWSRTFSGVISSGVPMLQSVKITGQTSGNAVVEEAMDEVYESVKRGGTIAAPLERNPIFPPMVAQMVSVGEETGQLDHMLAKIADFYEAEVDAKVKALTALLEPVMIIFIGAMVGFIVISMYLPIFSLYDKIR